MIPTIDEALQKDSEIIFAHRGVSAYLPENTMRAFHEVSKRGFQFLECDVQITADLKAVIIHDKSLKRVANVPGYVFKKTAKELRDLDVGSWKDEAYADQKIPYLEELMQFSKDKIFVNLELKPFGSKLQRRHLLLETLRLIHELEMTNQVLLSSFDHLLLGEIREIDSEITIGILQNQDLLQWRFPAELIHKVKPKSFHCSVKQVSPELIRRCSEFNLPVFVYTVNDKMLYQDLSNMGVRGFFSDNPALLH